jgi:hypothetical protein
MSELIGIIRTLQAALCDATGKPLAQVTAAAPKPAS